MSTKPPIPGSPGKSHSQKMWDILVALFLFIVLVPVVIAVAMPLLPFALIGGAIYGGVRLHQHRKECGW